MCGGGVRLEGGAVHVLAAKRRRVGVPPHAEPGPCRDAGGENGEDETEPW